MTIDPHSVPNPVAPESSGPSGPLGSSDAGSRGEASVPPTSKRRFGAFSLIVVALVSGALSSLGSVIAMRTWDADSHSAGHVDSGSTLYQCPMHPSIIQDHPGNCPICGMKLVKVDKAQAGAHPSAQSQPRDHTVEDKSAVPGLVAVDIDPARQQLIGLKTTEATQGPVSGSFRTVGRVAIDETRVRHVNLKIPGFVERIYVDYIGKKVKKGDPLFSIYSPELLSTQEEYLLALRTQSELSKAGGGALAGAESSLVAAARRKLELWDISAAEMDEIAKTREPKKTLTLHSPATGVVTKKDVVEGMKLDAGAMPYEIVDLSSVWVLADVYESELRFVKEGMSANLTLAAFPNREFKGKVAFIDPLLDPQTRTVKVRITFPNPAGELRPEMFGDVVLVGAPHDGLRIPEDAVIDSGTQKVVFVAVGEGKFEPRVVEVGKSDQNQIEVIRGLKAGDRVVTRANFLIDSESRLRASLSNIGAPEPSLRVESARVLPPASALAPAVREPPPAAPPKAASPGMDHSGHR